MRLPEKWKVYYRDKERKKSSNYRMMNDKEKDETLSAYAKTYIQLLKDIDKKNSQKYIGKRKVR